MKLCNWPVWATTRSRVKFSWTGYHTIVIVIVTNDRSQHSTDKSLDFQTANASEDVTLSQLRINPPPNHNKWEVVDLYSEDCNVTISQWTVYGAIWLPGFYLSALWHRSATFITQLPCQSWSETSKTTFMYKKQLFFAVRIQLFKDLVSHKYQKSVV